MTVVNVYPTLLGTYGDRGNATVLAARAVLRGIEATVVEVGPEDPVPSTGDLYVLGGAEDAAQVAATARLAGDGGLQRALEAGASLLAVCAGFQVIGSSFWAAGREVAGLGLVDATSVPGAGPRAVGELLAQPEPGPSTGSSPSAGSAAQGLPVLSGYENHAGVTRLGPGVPPLGRVLSGVGNGDGTEGVLWRGVVGTYLHGPVLARNPALADLLLSRALGELAPLDDDLVERFRAQRLAAVSPGGSASGWLRRWRRR